jgi:hypothetical protein
MLAIGLRIYPYEYRCEKALFTEMPRRGLLGNPVSGTRASRKLGHKVRAEVALMA